MAVSQPVLAVERQPRIRNRALRRFLAKRSALVAGGFVLLFVAIALFAPLIAPYDPIKTHFFAVRQAPSLTYLLGTDEVGRDLLSRLIWGARASLFAGVVPESDATAVARNAGRAAGWTPSSCG